MDYEFLEMTSDVMFRAYGKDEKKLFEHAAKAMFSVLSEIERVKPLKSREIEVSAESLEELLFDWLSTLLTTAEIEEMFFSEFKVNELDFINEEFKLKAVVKGEIASVQKGQTHVKGVTYYGLKIKKEKGMFNGTVTLDI